MLSSILSRVKITIFLYGIIVTVMNLDWPNHLHYNLLDNGSKVKEVCKNRSYFLFAEGFSPALEILKSINSLRVTVRIG